MTDEARTRRYKAAPDYNREQFETAQLAIEQGVKKKEACEKAGFEHGYYSYFRDIYVEDAKPTKYTEKAVKKALEYIKNKRCTYKYGCNMAGLDPEKWETLQIKEQRAKILEANPDLNPHVERQEKAKQKSILRESAKTMEPPNPDNWELREAIWKIGMFSKELAGLQELLLKQLPNDKA